MKNRFETLQEALDTEDIAHMWDCTPINYDETRSLTFDDGSRYGHYISIYRDECGRYERPIHYSRN